MCPTYVRTHASFSKIGMARNWFSLTFYVVCFVLAASAGFPFRLSLKENTAAKTLPFLFLHLGTNSALLPNRKTRTETHRSLFVSNPRIYKTCVCERESFLAPCTCKTEDSVRRSNTLFPPSFLYLSPVSGEKNVL